MDLAVLENHELQSAIQRNLVSFPSQAPVFPRQSRSDIQWRVAVLYFVRRWSLGAIARRYGLSRERAGQIVKAWRILSVRHGYIQEIPEEPFARVETKTSGLDTAFPAFAQGGNIPRSDQVSV